MEFIHKVDGRSWKNPLRRAKWETVEVPADHQAERPVIVLGGNRQAVLNEIGGEPVVRLDRIRITASGEVVDLSESVIYMGKADINNAPLSSKVRVR